MFDMHAGQRYPCFGIESLRQRAIPYKECNQSNWVEMCSDPEFWG